MAASTNMPQVVARKGAITFLVCLCMNMTPFCTSGSNGQMKVVRIQSRKDGRLAEKRGYRMRDDASAKVADRQTRHKCRVNVILFFSSCRLSRGEQSESMMALI
jgi:hypothetical protein